MLLATSFNKLVCGAVKECVTLPAVLKHIQSSYKRHSTWPSIDELPFDRLIGGYPTLPRNCTPPFSSSAARQYCIDLLIEVVRRVHSVVYSRPEDDPPVADNPRQSLPEPVIKMCAMLEAFLIHCGVSPDI